jgi:hypothetical protein
MPVYEYLCPNGHIFERLLPVSQYLEKQFCSCGDAGQKVILHAPKVFGDYPGYVSPASGQWVEGRRARQEDLKRTGCRPYEDGERERAMKIQQEEEVALDRKVDQIVEQTLASPD